MYKIIYCLYIKVSFTLKNSFLSLVPPLTWSRQLARRNTIPNIFLERDVLDNV